MNSYDKAECKSNEQIKKEQAENRKKRKAALTDLKESIKKTSKTGVHKLFNIRSDESKEKESHTK